MLNSKRKDAIKTSNPTIKLYFFLFRSTTSLFHCTQGKRYQYNVKTVSYTHLDVYKRQGITAENLSHILKHNDIKKSDAYQSGFLEGTTPAYEAYMRLKKSLAASIN